MGELWKLSLVFFQIGLFSIGGGYAIIPLIQELVVEKYAWVSQRIFTDIITISQMTPGPLAVNASTFCWLSDCRNSRCHNRNVRLCNFRCRHFDIAVSLFPKTR